jgi:hypothetical protein
MLIRRPSHRSITAFVQLDQPFFEKFRETDLSVWMLTPSLQLRIRSPVIEALRRDREINSADYSLRVKVPLHRIR